MMKSAITAIRISNACLLLLVSGVVALSQGVPGQENTGVIPMQAASRETTSGQPGHSYSDFIDEVNGVTGDVLVRYAIAHNGELAAAQQAIAEARGKLRQAGVRGNPKAGRSLPKTATGSC